VADGTAPRLQRITDYPALLAEAWGQHLAPRDASAPTVISTFAGCGGSSLGYSMAGFRELLAVEWEQNAADTFRLNFPHVPLYHGDIAKLSVEECLRLTGVAPGELDVFDGSPPCQGFSTAGKREIGDQRNQLFREFVRLLSGLRPRAFVMENVSGMVKGDFKVVFAEILRTLKACGYRVSARLLNAMWFGVPQSRERMIFAGVRDDLGVEPSHPSGWSEPSGPAIDATADAGLYLSAKQFGAVEAHKARQAAKGNGFGWQEVSSAKPSHAIVKNMMIGGANTRLVRDGQRWRYLSDVEIKNIGSFPHAFVFTGRESMIERIGNSVPPLLMRSIARHVRTLVARG
jgi:DNA (cytosine-5)-methyltransferase 1